MVKNKKFPRGEKILKILFQFSDLKSIFLRIAFVVLTNESALRFDHSGSNDLFYEQNGQK